MTLSKDIPLNSIVNSWNHLESIFENYAHCVGVNWAEVSFSSQDVVEVFLRVHKAKHYYKTYLDEDLEEHYETAILAYWILKLRIFSDESQNFSTANIKLASLLLYSVAVWRNPKRHLNPSEDAAAFWTNFCYALHYRGINHEAIMHVAEALVL